MDRPDLWLGERSEYARTDFDGRLRRCFVLGRLNVGQATTGLWVRLDPALVLFGRSYQEVVLQARHVGNDVADLGDNSISVYVSEILSKDGLEQGEVQPGALHLLAWADVARDPAFLPPTQEEGFDRIFDELRAYAERVGDANLGQDAQVGDRPLGNWVHNIKRTQAHGDLRADWASRLESLPEWRWGADAVRDWESHPTDRLMWLQAPADGSTTGLDGRLRICDAIGNQPPIDLKSGMYGTWVYVFPVTDLPVDEPGMLVLAARDADGMVRAKADDAKDVDVAHVTTWDRLEDGRRRPSAVEWLGRATVALDPALLPPMIDEEWQRGLAALRHYRERIGHCHVPFDHVPREQAGPIVHLGGWVLRARMEHRRGMLAPDRATQLESIPDWAWTYPT